jgi:hypothetical protein
MIPHFSFYFSEFYTRFIPRLQDKAKKKVPIKLLPQYPLLQNV